MADAPVTARELADLLDRGIRLDAANLARREMPDVLRHLIYDWIDARRLLDSAERRIREAAHAEAVEERLRELGRALNDRPEAAGPLLAALEAELGSNHADLVRARSVLELMDPR